MAAVVCCGLGLSLAAPSWAGDWRITPSASLDTNFSDNANAANDREDRNSDLVTTVSPGVAISGSGGRVSLNLNYSYNRFLSMQDTADESASHSLLANGQTELYDRVMFLSYSSSITRQVIDSAEPVSTVDTGSDNNRTTVRTLSMQPFFLHHFGTWLETESRYSFDWTQTETDEITDSRTLGESFAFNSGRRFSVFTFSGNLEQNKTIRADGAPATKTTDLSTDYRLRVHRKFSLLAGLGWQNIDDDTLEEEIRGITWDVGFSAQPNSRSSIDLTFGRNFDTDSISLNSSYALSSRTSVTASYSEALTTSDQELTDDLSLFVDDGTGTLVHAITGEVFDPSNPNQDFRTTLSRQRVLSVGFTASRRRSSYGASFVWNRTEDEATDILSRVMTLSLDYSRTVNSRLSASLSGSATLNDPGTDDQREDRTFSGSVSLTYRLMKNTNASLTYRGTATKSNFGENNFHDNTVTLSLSHTF